MEWITVISLIVVGLVLLIVEVIFIPGTTVVGFAGFLVMVAGVIFGFYYFGSDTGWMILGGTAGLSGVLFYLAFKVNVWSRFAHKATIDSKVNEGELDQFKEGMIGIAVSALRPFGNAEINSKIIEVTTLGDYVDTGSRVKIIKILSNQLIVEPLN
jgi:membrane-bound ClpP family serine protease